MSKEEDMPLNLFNRDERMKMIGEIHDAKRDAFNEISGAARQLRIQIVMLDDKFTDLKLIKIKLADIHDRLVIIENNTRCLINVKIKSQEEDLS